MPPAATLTDPTKLAAELANSHPVATMPPETPPEPAKAEPPPLDPETVEPDSNGSKWDASRFKVDANGQPRRDKIGRFIPKGIGKAAKAAKVAKPQSAAKPQGPQSFIPEDTTGQDEMKAGEALPSPAPETPAAAPQYAALGAVYTQAGISLAMALLGPDWKPDNKDEFEELAKLTAAYLEAEQVQDLSPKWAMLFGFCTYAGKRLPRPKTQTRLAGWKTTLSAWWTGRRNASDLKKLSREAETPAN